MSRVPYSEHPARHEYRLTDSGRDLWPALSAMRQWGDQHGAPGRPRMRSVHIECGTPLRTATVCDSCGVPVGGHEAQLRQVPKRASDPIGPITAPADTSGWGHEPGLVGEHDELGAVVCVELHQ
jgi:hypothetical protein